MYIYKYTYIYVCVCVCEREGIKLIKTANHRISLIVSARRLSSRECLKFVQVALLYKLKLDVKYKAFIR